MVWRDSSTSHNVTHVGISNSYTKYLYIFSNFAKTQLFIMPVNE